MKSKVATTSSRLAERIIEHRLKAKAGSSDQFTLSCRTTPNYGVMTHTTGATIAAITLYPNRLDNHNLKGWYWQPSNAVSLSIGIKRIYDLLVLRNLSFFMHVT